LNINTLLQRIRDKAKNIIFNKSINLCDLIDSSELFDHQYFLNQCLSENLKTSESRSSAISAYLHQIEFWQINPSQYFDGKWYLKTYPDVHQAQVNPLIHYIRFGKFEGRQSGPNRAIVWEYYLWRGASDTMQLRLEGLLSGDAQNESELSYASWALARWFAYQKEWAQAVDCIHSYANSQAVNPNQAGPWLVGIQAAIECGKPQIAIDFLDRLKAFNPHCTDMFLAEANIQSVLVPNVNKADEVRLTLINSLYAQACLSQIKFKNPELGLKICNITAVEPDTAIASKEVEKVSVIVPMYNASETILATLGCLVEQTWSNLEVIIVDDYSQDNSCQLVEQFLDKLPAELKRNWQLLKQPANKGAYAARNRGALSATGNYITVHDADDWSHPQKIEYQVNALLEAPAKKASISFLARADQTLMFTCWRIEERWIYRNISSLMVQRSVIEKIGYWDDISAGADTEYYYRLLRAFGSNAIIEVLPNIPLSFLLSTPDSLTQQAKTHLITQFLGVRKCYLDAARRWHSSVSEITELYLAPTLSRRPFLIPSSLSRNVVEVDIPNPIDFVQQSDYFDQAWYVRNNSDLHNQMIEPVEHYWSTQQTGQRDPGPNFSQSGYLYQMENQGINDIDPLMHFLTADEDSKLEPVPFFKGLSKPKNGRPTVLLAGHAAGLTLYGGERSLLDLLNAFESLNFNVVVTLPSALNRDYVELLRAHSLGVVIIPDGWWQLGKLPCVDTIRHFQELFERFKVDVVHVNTLVQDNVLVAAHQAGIKLVVHVRELLTQDPALCAALNASPAQGYAHVTEVADLILANSQCMYNSLTASNVQQSSLQTLPSPPIIAIPNTIDMSTLVSLPARDEVSSNKICVAMLSSNIAKKGIWDFVDVAVKLNDFADLVGFKLFGPKTAEIEQIIDRKQAGELTNLEYCGYIEDPAEALFTADIVVNLSHFQESFGRTVLEAMAAAKPVVCYDWGALGELVINHQSGYLVSFGDVEAVSSHILNLANNRQILMAMGTKGREHANNNYSESVFVSKIASAYSGLISGNIDA
jgi:glycosyltransferase involved in cell wall biosynthesis